MPQKIVLKSFAELADVLDVLDLGGPAADAESPPEPEPDLSGPVWDAATAGPEPEAEADTAVALAAHPAQPSEVGDGSAPAGPAVPDLAGLLAELDRAGATLATVVRQDQEARALARRDLERYDALVADQRQAEAALARARQVRAEAEALAGAAFAPEARAAAERVAEVAVRIESAAAGLAEERGRAAEGLVASLDLERLLAERRREEEAESARAAEAQRAERLSGALAGASSALEAGRLEEARAQLGPVRSEYPDDAAVASLLHRLAQREASVKALAAEEALWEARREHKKDPEGALARLEALDVAGLPDPLARQVFGTWAKACARLCRRRGLAEPLRYAPDPGRGALLAREAPGGPHRVVRVLGLGPEWRVGSPVAGLRLTMARPLRLDD
jgi:hypothetical protein